MTQSKEDPHDRAVQAIAEGRMSYPDKNAPKWKTWINTKEKKNMGVKANGDSVYPDIVVVDTETNKAVIAGEIETEDTINADEAKQWDRYGKLCGTCYVYVPEGYEKQAKELIEKDKLSVTGLRTYRFEDSQITIHNVA